MKPIKQPRSFNSTRWLQNWERSHVAIWALTDPDPLKYMEVIEACANGEALSQVDATVVLTIMESPEFLKPKLNKKQRKIYDKAYERYCAEVVLKMMKK